MPISDKPKVYLTSFVQTATDHFAVALADDGEVLAEHVCSSPAFFRGDLHDRLFRHDAYLRKYGAWGDGDRYELVECWSSEVPAEVIERNRLLYAEDQADPNTRPYAGGGVSDQEIEQLAAQYVDSGGNGVAEASAWRLIEQLAERDASVTDRAYAAIRAEINRRARSITAPYRPSEVDGGC